MESAKLDKINLEFTENINLESKCKISSKSENSIVTGKTEVENRTSSRGIALVRGPNWGGATMSSGVINDGEKKEVLSVDKRRAVSYTHLTLPTICSV